MERCVASLIDGGGSRRHGAVLTRGPMREDELAQEGDAVWRRGGVDGRESWHTVHATVQL